MFFAFTDKVYLCDRKCMKKMIVKGLQTKSFLVATVMLLGSIITSKAQVSLAGHTYHNANITAGLMDEAMKDIDQKMAAARKRAIAEGESKKGRQLTAAEIQEIDKRIAESRQMLTAFKKGIRTEITIEFKTDKNMVMKADMKISDDAMKAAGIDWLRRKAMKAMMLLSPKSQKGTYIVENELVILNDGEEKDTLRLSSDVKYLYGILDKNTHYTLTRTK